MTTTSARTSLLSMLLLCSLAPAQAVLAPAHSELFSPGSDNGAFGSSISIDDEWMAVGEPGHQSGLVRTYRWAQDWQADQVLRAPDGAIGDGFGQSVHVKGNWLIVGAPRDDNGASGDGSAYLYHFDGTQWQSPTKLLGAASQAGASFGITAAIGDDVVVIGAPNADSTGVVYVYGPLADPTLLATIQPDEACRGFGRSVDIDGSTLAIGANRDNTRGPDAGALHIYTGADDAWYREAVLTTLAPSEHAWLGTSVAVSGDTAVAGAYRSSADGAWAGAAYVFERVSGFWSLTARLTAPEPVEGEFFGYSVDIWSAGIAVGAPGTGAGAAYLLSREGTGWGEPLEVVVESRGGDQVGAAVALGSGFLAVGAPRGTDDQDNAGASAGEIAVFTVDLDGDRVTDRDEWDLGTDSLNPDTDGDGLWDGDELDWGADPLAADSDGDTLLDGAEVHTHSTSPVNTESDGDLYGDGQEVFCGSDPADETSVPDPTGGAECVIPNHLEVTLATTIADAQATVTATVDGAEVPA